MDNTKAKGTQVHEQTLRLLDEVHSGAQDFRNATARLHLSYIVRPEVPRERTEVGAMARGDLLLSIDRIIDLAKLIGSRAPKLSEKPHSVETTIGRSAAVVQALAPDIAALKGELEPLREVMTSTAPGVVHIDNQELRMRAQKIIDAHVIPLDTKQENMRGFLFGTIA